jgi:hypothetical protein
MPGRVGVPWTLAGVALVLALAARPAEAASGGLAQGDSPARAAGLEAPAAQAEPPAEVLAEVRVHGNHTTPDAEVLRLAGLVIGQRLDAGVLREVESRLRKSRRFEAVEIRKRYRSLSETREVALILIVREHPVPDRPPSPLGPFRKIVDSGLVLPILTYTDGYGLTYGARASFVDILGHGGRISVPFTWGATKRAAVELDKAFPGGVVDRVQGGASISSRKNPYYGVDDHRTEVWARAGRELAKGLRARVHVGLTDGTFGGQNDRFGSYGADLLLDTRLDPAFPRNAVFATLGWDGLAPRNARHVNLLRTDFRGYVGLVRQSVLCVRAQYARADGQLPPYERLLLGGADTLRGYRAGSFAGDNLAAASVELRVPLGSPLRMSRAGLEIFADTGTAYDRGTHLVDARFRYGAGGGVFLASSLFHVTADLAFRQGGSARLHVTAGILF